MLNIKDSTKIMVLQETYTLSNNVQLPRLAFGTWQLTEEEAQSAVKDALKAGYRMVDTAVQYENETGVGKAVRESGISREEVTVVTKIPHDVKTSDGAKAEIEGSLKRLGMDYIDLLLIHSPKPWPELFAGSEKTYYEENLAVWRAMEEAYRDGKVKAIGVSNFEPADMQNIIDHADIMPMVNQIRVHVGHVPTAVLEYCREHQIQVMAFSPNATGKLMQHPVVTEMAVRYGVSVPQLCIRFCLQLSTLPLPKTRHIERMRQNADVDFIISDSDMQQLLQVEEVSSLPD